MTPPNIEAWLDDSGLDPYAFRLLGVVSRRAGREGYCNEAVANMAGRCGMSKRRAQNALQALVANGYLKVKQAATPNSPAHYTLAKKMYVGDAELVALFVPASLDDAGLSLEAFRLAYHYLRWGWDGEVLANHARAARTCGRGLSSRTTLLKLEEELCAANLLRAKDRVGKHTVFSGPLLEFRARATSDEEPSISCTPTVHAMHPDRPRHAPKGLFEGLKKGSRHDTFLKNPKRQEERSITYFKELLGARYEGFAAFVGRRKPTQTMSEVTGGWLDSWGEAGVGKIVAYLRAHDNPWTAKYRDSDLGLHYGLYDTLEGGDRNQPQALVRLQLEVQADKRQRERASLPHFEPGDVVRVRDRPEAFEIEYTSDTHAFMVCGGLAKLAECTFVRRADPVVMSPSARVPDRKRRRLEARARLAERRAVA